MATNPESIDTSIILRAILNDAPSQSQKARALFSRDDTVFHVSDLAVTEAVFVLEKCLHFDRSTIAEMLSIFLSNPSINYNVSLFSNVFPFYAEHPQLSFNDCCLATYAALNQAEPLWTFDRKLAAQSPTAKELKQS